MPKRVVVTGAFSYTGATIARLLIERGWEIHTLTNRKPSTESPQPITFAPLLFNPEHLIRELHGADALVSTYWIRFPQAGLSFDTTVANGRMLFDAARKAGVRRIVHLSVSNADAHSRLDYYRGKAQLDEALRQNRLPFAILRPTLVVGINDILTNNIAWILRRFPFFGVPAAGTYRLQPITLDDCGELVADALESCGNLEWDAAGPEVFTFRQFVMTLAEACGLRRCRLPSVPPWLALAAIRLVGWTLRDVVLTKQELQGLMEERLLSHEPARGKRSVRDWLMKNGTLLGQRYKNDLHRHFGSGRHRVVSDGG